MLCQLFDFDAEVRPILEVLVGKTLEQSLLEVLAEEELADLRQQQRMFEELRNAEMAEQQRLEEQDRRLVEEKVRLSLFTSQVTIQRHMWSRPVIIISKINSSGNSVALKT